jgi:hypothetical protein
MMGVTMMGIMEGGLMVEATVTTEVVDTATVAEVGAS